jgi:hypothetical protein
VTAAEALRVNAVDVAHQTRQIGLARANDEMGDLTLRMPSAGCTRTPQQPFIKKKFPAGQCLWSRFTTESF